MAIVDVIIKRMDGQIPTCDAKGEYDTVTNKITVKADSLARSRTHKDKSIQNCIDKLNLPSTGQLIVPQDVTMAVSSAAKAVLAYNSGGYGDWRVASTGKTIDEQFRQNAGTAQQTPSGKSIGEGEEEEEAPITPIAENKIFYGVPGCGKSYQIKEKIKEIVKLAGEEFKEENIVRVVFHPDYTYSDFVGQILPVLENGQVHYKFVPGPFTRALKLASKPSLAVFLVIEEINRGNASAIFGDIFQLLDRKQDGSSEYSIKNADIAKAVYNDIETNISLPNNFWIFATMNTSDQNVFTLDTAFQRRWEQEMVKNTFDNNNHNFVIEDTGVTWQVFADAINKIIAKQDITVSSGDKRLGAWFIQPDKNNTVSKERFMNKVLKYLWEDAFKFSRSEYFKVDTLEALFGSFKTAGFSDAIFTNKIEIRNENGGNQQEE